MCGNNYLHWEEVKCKLIVTKVDKVEKRKEMLKKKKGSLFPG